MKFNEVISFIELRENVSKKNILAGLDMMSNTNELVKKHDFKRFLRFIVPYVPNFTQEQNLDLYNFFNNVYRSRLGFEPIMPSKTPWDENDYNNSERADEVLQQLAFVKGDEWEHQLPGDDAEAMVVKELLQAYKRHKAKSEQEEFEAYTSTSNLPDSPPRGFWVTKDGKFIIVQKMYDHDAALIKNYPELFRGMMGSALLDKAVKLGFIRMGKIGNNYGLSDTRFTSSTARKTAKDIALHYQMGVEDDFEGL